MVALVCSCLFLLLVVAYSMSGVLVSCLLSFIACYAVYFIACFLYVRWTRVILTVHAFYYCVGIIKGFIFFFVLCGLVLLSVIIACIVALVARIA